MKPMTNAEAVVLTHALFDAYEVAQSTGRTPGTEYDPRGGEALLDRVHHVAAERGDARRTVDTLRAEAESLRTELARVKGKLAQAEADLATDNGRGRLRVALVKCARQAENAATPDAELALGAIAGIARAALEA